MDQVIRQDNDTFLEVLNHLHYGDMNRNDVDFIFSRCLDKVPVAERDNALKNSIHLCPTWKMTHKITYEYLKSFNRPVAIVTPVLNTIKASKNQLLFERHILSNVKYIYYWGFSHVIEEFCCRIKADEWFHWYYY